MDLVRESGCYLNQYDIGGQLPDLANFTLKDILCYQEGKTKNDQTYLTIMYSKK